LLFHRKGANRHMDKLQELVEKRLKLITDMRALNDNATDGVMSAEEEARFQEMDEEQDKLRKNIDRHSRQAEVEKSLGAPTTRAAPSNASAVTTADSTEGGGSSKSKWRNLAELVQCSVRAANSGFRDPRLIETRVIHGMNETTPAEGGYWVEPTLITTMLTKAYETSKLVSRCTQIPIGPNSNGLRIPMLDESSRKVGFRFGGIRAYWLGEGEAKTESFPKFTVNELRLGKLATLIPLTDELMQDAVALQGMLEKTMPAVFGYEFDEAIIRGSGTNQPLGILPSGAAVEVAAEGTQADGTILYQNILNMMAHFSPSPGGNPAWYVSRSTLPALGVMSLAVGTGGVPVYLPANGAAGQMFSTLFGYPVIPLEQSPVLGEVGDIMLADMSEYLWIYKGGLETAVSIHVYFKEDQTLLRFVQRVNGQPLSSAPIAPAQGDADTSPFVVLEARAA
jgi:HK97 family phage major capsid protein